MTMAADPDLRDALQRQLDMELLHLQGVQRQIDTIAELEKDAARRRATIDSLRARLDAIDNNDHITPSVGRHAIDTARQHLGIHPGDRP